jgi:hypothetical protein
MNISLINLLITFALIMLIVYCFYKNYRNNQLKSINSGKCTVWSLILLPIKII